jgi:hypothetical protein
MKTILSLVMVSLSLSSFASTIGPRSSWEQINKSRNHVVRTPMKPGALIGGLFNACVDGNNLKSINPVKFCAEGRSVEVDYGEGSRGLEWVCDRFETSHVTISRDTTKTECADWVIEGEGNLVCKKFVEVPFTIPLDYVLDVETFGGEASYQLAFRKAYSIPACK